LFLAHIRGELDQLPWSEGTLNDETRLIEAELCALIEKRGWWSIASQPAVDGVRSSDPILGWGPRGGFVFQKAFVEFWIPSRDWKQILRPFLERTDIAEEVSWYASPCTSHDMDGNSNATTSPPTEPGPRVSATDTFASSSPSSAANSVTWGSFPGKEIVTPTIIEEISFRAWADEAFDIWAEWERCYAPGSQTRSLIAELRKDSWLVNVIGHRFQEPGRLWEILMQA
jgi:methylenetetrahydrofolate reductase (NADPH)